MNENNHQEATELATILAPENGPKSNLSSCYLELQAENQRLKDCLSWYADENNWLVPVDERGYVTTAFALSDVDGGERARKCLRGESE